MSAPEHFTLGGYPNSDPHYISPEEERAMEEQQQEDRRSEGFSIAKPTVWQRISRTLFPQRYLMPAEEAVGWAPGEISTDSYVHVSFGDRVRLLVSGKAVLRARMQTDVIVNEARTRSTFSVMAPWDQR